MAASPPIIEDRLEAIRELCLRYGVARLELFGSAAQGRFDPTTSDLDFLVEFKEPTPCSRADAYFGLLESLQNLFAIEIDLVEDSAIRNPYFRKGVDAARTVLYAA